jgi:hypothetical protein
MPRLRNAIQTYIFILDGGQRSFFVADTPLLTLLTLR